MGVFQVRWRGWTIGDYSGVGDVAVGVVGVGDAHGAIGEDLRLQATTAGMPVSRPDIATEVLMGPTAAIKVVGKGLSGGNGGAEGFRAGLKQATPV